VLNAGDVVLRAVLDHELMPISRADAGRLFMEYFGELALGPLLLQRLRPSERVIIDGLRLPFAKELLKDRLGRLFHLHLDAACEVRRCRLLLRDGRVDVSERAESFLHYLKQDADLVIANLDLCEPDLVPFHAPVGGKFGYPFHVALHRPFEIGFSDVTRRPKLDFQSACANLSSWPLADVLRVPS
jgi:hypothetical protein